MFYFLLPMLFSYDYLLIFAAVIPAIILMIKVYRSDRLEKESPYLLGALVVLGVLSSLIALVLERIFSGILNLTVSDPKLYSILLYFGVVAISEEGAKFLLLHLKTWKSPEFNCQYDGVVYAVFVSLGFALWENISYVLHYGFSTAIVRALTAIPGHTCFGVFMGVFYGLARKEAGRGNRTGTKTFRILAVLVPVVLHGAYDYIASSQGSAWYFVGFIVVLFLISYLLVTVRSRRDRFIR